MKLTKILGCLLLIPSLVLGNGFGFWAAAAKKNVATSAYIFSDDFEDGTLGKWTHTVGASDTNIFVSAANPIVGSYTLYAEDPGVTTAWSPPSVGADYDTLYVGFLISNPDVAGAAAGILRIKEEAYATDLLTMTISTASKIKVGVSGGSTTSDSTSAVSTTAGVGTPVMLAYTRGTGSNAVAKFYISTDDSTWTQTRTVSNGTSTDYPRFFQVVGVASWNVGYHLDNVLISDTELTVAEIIAGP